MKLNEFFSKIYCINLDNRPDRYKECSTEFEKFEIVAERISGIDCKLTFNKQLNITAGAYGLLLTNIKIIEESIQNEYKNVLIFEDDVIFNTNFQNIFTDKIAYLPDDWDMLYLGGSHVFSKGKFNLITGDKNFSVTDKNYKTIKNELCKTTWTQTTHAVALNAKFLPILINSINENLTQPMGKEIYPIDRQYCNLQQVGYNAYTFLPSIALQRPSYSDIENVFIDYNKTIHLF